MAFAAAAAIAFPALAGASPVYTPIYTFPSSAAGNMSIDEGVIVNGGVLYGVTRQGGRTGSSCADGCGLVFSLAPTSNPTVWQKTTLFRFGGGGTGFEPRGQLLLGPDGTFYGVTYQGGKTTANCPTGCGTIFSLTPPSGPSAAWTQTVLYRFQDQTDGMSPLGGLVMDETGALYGVTQYGGPPNTNGNNNMGLVFKLSPPVAPKKAWTKSNLVVFDYINGRFPNSPLTLGARGRLYGTTQNGYTLYGNVFELVPPAAPGGAWTYNMLHNFTNSDGNSGDRIKLTFGPDGSLYGTTTYGGPTTNCDSLGCGVVFRLKPLARNGWGYAVLHYFNKTDGGGRYPESGVVVDPSGALYGATNAGGANDRGTLYKLTPPVDNKHWQFSVVHDFTNASNERSGGPLFIDGQVIYGETGGSGTFGTVFSFTA
jgi:uncharacterized repeat protein (TIGR03803 family)